MVRVKSIPGKAFTSVRATVRETTRDVIHYVSIGDRYNGRQREPNRSRNYHWQSEYMAEELSSTRLPDHWSRMGEATEKSNTFTRAYQGRNEYMTDEQGYSAYSVGSRQREDREETISSSRLYKSGDEHIHKDKLYSWQEKPSDRYNSRLREPSHSRNYNGRNEYMTEEPSFARPLDNRSRRNETAENSNGFSRAYQSRNEYMTDDKGYSGAYSVGSRQREDRENTMTSSRLYDSRYEYMKDGRQYSRQEKARNIETRDPERIPFQRRQVNETDDSASVLESARDSPAPSDFMIHRGDADVIPMSRQMVDMSERNRSVVDRSLPKAKGERARQMLQSTSSATLRGRGGTMDRGDASSVATTSSRRSGGVPRFARIPQQRHQPGVKALLEIRRLRKSVHSLIPKAGLQRVIGGVVAELYPGEGYRFTRTALEALQEAAEAALIQLFEDAKSCAMHVKRVTVMLRDIRLARGLKVARGRQF